MNVVCLDLEGVLIPEMWIEVADANRDRGAARHHARHRRLRRADAPFASTPRAHGITIADILEVTRTVEPLPGAAGVPDRAAPRRQVAILSDTFVQFVDTIMAPRRYPFLLCNELVVDESGSIVNYELRQRDGKRAAVEAFRA
jgi:phosphoserine / homoserine phosphotransferase